jgi:sugar phosphate isomerase/epimerase
MKLSIVLSTHAASFDSVAYKGDLERNVERIARLGYDGVELAVRDPRLLDVGHVQKVVHQWGLEVPAIGTGQAYAEEGLSFTAPEESLREQAIERIFKQIELARSLGALVIVGLIRGKVQTGIAATQARQWLVSALVDCARHAAPDVRLVLEPLNRYETNLINTVAEGLDLIEEVGTNNLGLLFDTFHANIEEGSIESAIRNAGDRLLHFHVADSNRWYPGAGHLDFGQVISTLDILGYQGYLSAEIMPLPSAEACAERTILHLHRCCSAGLRPGRQQIDRL